MVLLGAIIHSLSPAEAATARMDAVGEMQTMTNRTDEAGDRDDARVAGAATCLRPPPHEDVHFCFAAGVTLTRVE